MVYMIKWHAERQECDIVFAELLEHMERYKMVAAGLKVFKTVKRSDRSGTLYVFPNTYMLSCAARSAGSSGSIHQVTDGSS